MDAIFISDINLLENTVKQINNKKSSITISILSVPNGIILNDILDHRPYNFSRVFY